MWITLPEGPDSGGASAEVDGSSLDGSVLAGLLPLLDLGLFFLEKLKSSASCFLFHYRPRLKVIYRKKLYERFSNFS